MWLGRGRPAALAGSPGRIPVVVRVVHSGGITPLRLGEGYRIEPSAGLLSELRLLLGPESVRLERVAADGNGAAAARPVPVRRRP